MEYKGIDDPVTEADRRANEYIVHGFSADGTTSPGPCHTNCTNNNEVYSFHTGGAMHVFADGSVHFIRASMDIRQFVKLVTRAGQALDLRYRVPALPFGLHLTGVRPTPDGVVVDVAGTDTVLSG